MYKRQPLERLFTLGAIVLSVDVDARALVLSAVDGVVRQVLDGVERFTAAADQNAEIGADQIDQIAVFAGLHRVRHGVGAHVLQQPLDLSLIHI